MVPIVVGVLSFISKCLEVYMHQLAFNVAHEVNMKLCFIDKFCISWYSYLSNAKSHTKI